MREAGRMGAGGVLKWFLFTAAAILAITGAAKVWSAYGDVKLLTELDPIVGIQFKHLILAVGVAELVVAAVGLFGKRPRLALGLVAWMATNILVYRIGLSWMGWKKPCNCLGNITDALHISPHTADTIMKFVLGYLLVGSYGLLIWQWPEARRRERGQLKVLTSLWWRSGWRAMRKLRVEYPGAIYHPPSHEATAGQAS